jgi:pyrophosphatase PpaX
VPRTYSVLLDLDGTLVDTVPFILASLRHAFAGRRRAPTDAEWIAGIGQPLRVQLAAWAEGPDDVEALVVRYRDHQRLHHDASTRAYPGAVDAVRAVKEAGHAVGIVTGKLAGPAERTLAHVGLAPFVDALVGADTCPEHKPAPEPLWLALRRLGGAPTAALYLGDSPIDVAAGRAAGVVTVAALWGATAREVLLAARPDHALEHVGELPGLVARLAAGR